MKKSRSISLTLMASLAAACSDGARTEQGGTSFTAADTVRRCVDSTYQVVAEAQCAGPRVSGGYYPYFFYFGGRTMTSQGGATYVSGGSRTMPSIRGPVSRGGFGATGAGRTGRIGA